MSNPHATPAADPAAATAAPSGRHSEILRDIGLDVGIFGFLGLMKKLFAHGALDASVDMIKKFFSKTGEKAGVKAGERLSFMIWGMDKEDERRFNAAQNLLAENDRVVLSKRLADLTPAQSDYYRMTVMQDIRRDDENRTLDYDASVAATVRIIHMHSQMSPEEWGRQCKIMNYTLQEDVTLMQKFLKWADTELASTLRSETTRLNTELVQRRGNLRRSIRGFGWLFGN